MWESSNIFIQFQIFFLQMDGMFFSYSNFSSGFIDRIIRIYISRNPDDDKWIWQPKPLGSLTTSGAYQYIKTETKDENWKGWKVLWQLSIAPKVKLFLHKFSWNFLPTSDLFAHILHHHPDPCYVCNVHTDSASHILLECPVAISFWNLAQSKTGICFKFFNSSSSRT